MSTPEIGQGLFDDTSGEALSFAYLDIINRYTEIADEMGNTNEANIWQKNAKISLQTQEHGDLLVLDINGHKIHIGYYDPRVCEFVTYPELVDHNATPYIFQEADRIRAESIATFHTASQAPKSETRIFYDREAIRQLHIDHNNIFRMFELDKSMTVTWNFTDARDRKSKIEIDENTFIGIGLKSGSYHHYNRQIELPDQKLKVRIVGAYYEYNGEKRRHPPQLFVVGLREHPSDELIYNPTGVVELFDRSELNILTALAQDLRDKREQMLGFDTLSGGILVAHSDSPPESNLI